MGFFMDTCNRRVVCLVWAVNLWIFAAKLQGLQVMVNELEGALSMRGMSLKPDMEFMVSGGEEYSLSFLFEFLSRSS